MKKKESKPLPPIKFRPNLPLTITQFTKTGSKGNTMSITVSELAQKYSSVLKNFVTESDIQEKKNLSDLADLIAFCFEASSQNTPDEIISIQRSFSGQNGGVKNSSNVVHHSVDDEDEVFQRVLRDSQREMQKQNMNRKQQNLMDVQEFDASKIRRLLSEEEVAAIRHIKPNEVVEYRRNLVSSLAKYDSIMGARYKDSILEEMANIGKPPAQGCTVAILLPNGERITRVFGFDDFASSIYFWVAAQEKMIKDKIKPGHFVIVKSDGTELIPEITVQQQIDDKKILLNVRLF